MKPMDDLVQEPVAWVNLEPWLNDETWPDDCFSHGQVTGFVPLYTADQMREYAKKAVEAEREACATRAYEYLNKKFRYSEAQGCRDAIRARR